METRTEIKRKVAVFGLDGASFDLLQPWLDEGRLPNLARMLAEGVQGPLRSTIPPVSASAWASFATGTNPGQHGLIDFTYPSSGGYEIQVSNGRTRAVPALWEIIGRAGGESGVVSMPMTYPPQPLNGFMLCSFLTPSAESQYTYPADLKEEISQKVGSFPLHMSEKGRGQDPRKFITAEAMIGKDHAQGIIRNQCQHITQQAIDCLVVVKNVRHHACRHLWIVQRVGFV